MKKNKKGITLVELIICCGIIVMVGGACTALLMSGQTIFNRSSSSANAQLDTDVIQTYLTNVVPRARTVSAVTEVDVEANTTDFCLYFDGEDDGEEEDGVFTIRVNGKNTTIRSVTDFKYHMIPAGDGEDDAVKPQFFYTVYLSDGSNYSSGFVLINLNYKTCEVELRPDDPISLKDQPVCISTVKPAAGT